MKIIFIADFFVEDVLGGGELNNHELINMLISDGRSVKKIHSHMVTENFIEENRNSKFIVANFIREVRESCPEMILIGHGL